MPPKPKGKVSKTVIPETVEQINLQKYCPKEIFDVLLIIESDERSQEVLNNVIEIGRTYEDISCLTFITYDDVLELVKKHEGVSLPPSVKPTLVNVCTEATCFIELEEKLPTNILAKLMKLKLTEVMYQHYIKEVNKMQRRRKLEEDLNILTKECKKGDAEKGKGKGGKDSKKDSKSSKGTDKTKGKDKGSAKSEEAVIEDYTAIPIEKQNDIIFDDDIFNHVWFYAFQGFYDPDLAYELYNYNVPLTAVIKITANQSSDDTTTTFTETLNGLYDEFWTRLYKYFDGPRRLAELENTISMNFTCYEGEFKEIFQQLLYVIKNISDIKLQHVNYVRHLKMYEIQETYNHFPLECLELYNKMMDKVPLELSNEIVVLNNVLNEACARVDQAKFTSSALENPSRYSIRSLNKFSATNCVDACKLDEFFKSRHKLEPEKMYSTKPPKDFYTHECDNTNILLNTYKKYGRFICEPVLNMLRNQIPLHTLDQYLTDYSDLLHKHDIEPSTRTVTGDEEIFMHIFYLIFFSTFDCRPIVADFEDTELTENLQTYHKIDFVKSSQTVVLDSIPSEEILIDATKSGEIEQCEEVGIEEMPEEEYMYEEERAQWMAGTENEVDREQFLMQVQNAIEGELEGEGMYPYLHEESSYEVLFGKPFRNYYKRSAIQYFWKEKMSSDVMLQEIYTAHETFLYMEQIYSPGTDTLLLQYSDCLDEFGIHTKIYEQNLITPICLRDFCRYVSVERAQWLEHNKPPKYFRKCEELEICKGVNRINYLQLFQEYNHLLETTIKTEKETEEKVVVVEDAVTFDKMIEELMNYPPNSGIINECEKLNYKKVFLAYDLGTSYFEIKGGKTVFHSHDDVKVSVDNSRFIDEDPKCTLNVSCKGNSLVVHYNKFYFNRDYTFHMNLADGTIVTFIVFNPELKKSRKRLIDIKEPEEICSPEQRVKEEELGESADEILDEVKVLSVDRNYFKTLEDTSFHIGEENVTSGFAFKGPEEIFDSLRQAAATNCSIYKVNANAIHLKRLKQSVEIPLSNILNRILHKAIQKKHFGSFTKRFIPDNVKSAKRKSSFDVKIAWPNGLYITFFPSEAKNSYLDVKQEFVAKKEEHSLIEHEEFRLFAREGFILIKYIDGTIKILKSNGDSIYYEKLDANDEAVRNWRLRPCHCKNINDYRKKLQMIMRKNYEPTASTIAISRRAQFHSRKGKIIDPDLVNMLEESKVPYLKTTLLKFDGNRICVEKGRIVRKRMFHITDEQDYFAQEIYYERSDGFRSYFEKDGRLQVKFADGTKITTTIYVQPKTVPGGYVYVSLNFKYEHPNYATVLFSHDESLEIMLNNAVLKRDVKDVITLKVGEDISTTVKKENVMFQKTCLKCSSKYKCSINIHPFSEKTTERFLYVRDSYNKQFCCDYQGNCQRNSNYIKGPFNVLNCNHYKKRTYKKMFVVNRDFSGCMFWTDNMVGTLRKNMEVDENSMVNEYTDIDNVKVKVLKARRKVFNDYCNRFLNTTLLKEQMCLAKYKQQEVKQLFYTTFRIIRKMTDFQGIKKVLADIIMFFSKIGVGTKLLDILIRLFNEEDDDPEDNMSTKIIITEVVEPPICKCRKKKVDMVGKVDRWRTECEKYRILIRNNVINTYFESEFCEIVELGG